MKNRIPKENLEVLGQQIIGNMMRFPEYGLKRVKKYMEFQDLQFNYLIRIAEIIESLYGENLTRKNGSINQTSMIYEMQKVLAEDGSCEALLNELDDQSCKSVGLLCKKPEYWATPLRQDRANKESLKLMTSIIDAADVGMDIDLPNLVTRLDNILEPIEIENEFNFEKTYEEIVRQMNEGRAGCNTGFQQFDNDFGGLINGKFYVLAARPSQGKTTWALQVTGNLSNKNKRVVFITLETSCEDILKIFLSQQGGLYRFKFDRVEGVEKNEWMKTNTQIMNDDIRNWKSVILDDAKYRNPTNIKTTISQMHKKEPIDLVVVDHFDLLDHGDKHKRQDLNMGVSSQMFQNLAKDLDIPILLIHQINRQVENENRMPRMTDLRECGKLEQDADFIMFLSPCDEQGRMIKNSDEQKKSTLKSLIIAKNKTGPIGSMMIQLVGTSMTFEEI